MTPAHTPDDSAPPEPASRQLPPLAALRCFVVAARTASFTKAAVELCVTQGAVSRQIMQLEEFYGQPLFRRQARGLTLTDSGQLLAETASAALEQIAQTTRVLRRRIDVREVRFMVPTCAMLWAMPLLMRFQAQHPGFRLAPITTVSHRLDEDRFDVGLVYGRLDAPCAEQRPLFAERLTPVCSPRLTQGAQALRRPADLARHVLLHASAEHRDWRLWLDAADLHALDAVRGLDFQTLDLSNAAASEGYGVAMGDTMLAGPAIASGRLCAPFALQVATGFGYFLRWRAGQGERPEIDLLASSFEAALQVGPPAAGQAGAVRGLRRPAA